MAGEEDDLNVEQNPPWSGLGERSNRRVFGVSEMRSRSSESHPTVR